MTDPTPRTVGVLVFDDVEVLDMAGPFEVFAAARIDAEPGPAWRDAARPFDVVTIAARDRVISSTGGLRIESGCTFETAPRIDILVIPGGVGVRSIIETPDNETLQWIQKVAGQAERVTSVCTGAWVLARAGLLANRRATTHHLCLDRLAELDPSIDIVRTNRVVDDGVITAAGVASGIDMALYVVEKLCGPATAMHTAAYIEYPWSPSTAVGNRSPRT